MRSLRKSGWFICFTRNISHSQFAGLVKSSLDVLNTPDPNQKTKLARKVYREWYQNKLTSTMDIDQIQSNLPRVPVRPQKPELLPCSQIRDHKSCTSIFQFLSKQH